VKASRIELLDIDHVCVKVPMFSFTRLQGADPVLRVEMASTGEVACFSSRPLEAYLKGLLATSSFRLPNRQRSILLSLGPQASKLEFLSSAQALVDMGYVLYGTSGTAEFFLQHGVRVQKLHKPEHLRRAVSRRRSSVGPSMLNGEMAKLASDVAESLSRSASTSAVMVPAPDVDGVISASASTETSPRTGAASASPEGGVEKQLPNILDVSWDLEGHAS